MIDVNASLAARLIATQFPQWAGLPVRAVEQQGRDNCTFRVGDVLKARFPRAVGYAGQVEKEARWLPTLAPHLPIRIPAPCALGAPGEDYPFAWSVQDWIAGGPAGANQAHDTRFAANVAEFLNALRRAPAVGAPLAGAHNFHRGGRLSVYDREMREAADALREEFATHSALAVWDTALRTEWNRPPVWVHGDVAADNLLVADGTLVAAIDFGCVGAGDPACDLVLAWTLFAGEAREVFRQTIYLDAACWERARGWAIWKSMITLGRRPDNHMARRVVADVIAEG